MTPSRSWITAAVLALAVTGCGAGSATTHRAPAHRAPRSAETPPPHPHRAASPAAAGTHSARPSTPDAAVPPISRRARRAGLLDVRSIVPDAIIDLRYATRHNFTGVRLYPRDARCLIHKSMRHGLAVAARRLRRHGDVLVFWDCYRPHRVQVRMYRVVPNPNWVARPGPYATSHEAARSVDVTLARAHHGGDCPGDRVQRHCLRVMGTGFDNFTPRAYAYAIDGVGPTARSNRALLRHAMKHGGIDVYRGEWWHFDGPGALIPRPHLHVPVD